MALVYNGPERYEVLGNILKTNSIVEFNKGAEIGVRHAELSEYLLKLFKKMQLLLVDPYTSYDDLGYIFTEEEQNKILSQAKKRLIGYGSRANWIRKSSVEAAKGVEDSSLDFVFIDGEHTEAACTDDIYAWYTKVRPGGILSGHDYSMEGVSKAVKAWSEKFGKPIIFSDKNSDVWVMQI